MEIRLEVADPLQNAMLPCTHPHPDLKSVVLFRLHGKGDLNLPFRTAFPDTNAVALRARARKGRQVGLTLSRQELNAGHRPNLNAALRVSMMTFRMQHDWDRIRNGSE